MTTRRKRARPGDVLEVHTPRGLAYIHYTYVVRRPNYMEAIRVLPGFFATRPADFTALVTDPRAYFAFYPAAAAVSQGLVEVVAHHPVPPGQERPLVYRRKGATSRDGRVLAWIIYEGTQKTLVRELTEEQRYLPIDTIWMHDSMVTRLTREWRPEQDIGIPRALQEPAATREETKAEDHPADSSTPHRVQHFLYFPSAKASKAVAAQLATQGFKVDSRKNTGERNWLVLVEHTVAPGESTLDSVRETLERLAQEHSGEYDGHQTEVTPRPA